jgi:hypothetical protein
MAFQTRPRLSRSIIGNNGARYAAVAAPKTSGFGRSGRGRRVWSRGRMRRDQMLCSSIMAKPVFVQYHPSHNPRDKWSHNSSGDARGVVRHRSGQSGDGLPPRCASRAATLARAWWALASRWERRQPSVACRFPSRSGENTVCSACDAGASLRKLSKLRSPADPTGTVGQRTTACLRNVAWLCSPEHGECPPPFRHNPIYRGAA